MLVCQSLSPAQSDLMVRVTGPIRQSGMLASAAANENLLPYASSFFPGPANLIGDAPAAGIFAGLTGNGL